jgi:hypothetical protein
MNVLEGKRLEQFLAHGAAKMDPIGVGMITLGQQIILWLSGTVQNIVALIGDVQHIINCNVTMSLADVDELVVVSSGVTVGVDII